MMEDLEITVSDTIVPIEVIVEPQNTTIEVTISNTESDPEGVSQLRTELGDFKADLLLNYNISKL